MSQLSLARKALAKVLHRVSGSTRDPADLLHFSGERFIEILQSQAVPAIASVVMTPGFQQLVYGAIDPLRDDADSPARRRIKDYQVRIRDCCTVMRAFIETRQELLRTYVPIAGTRFIKLLAPHVTWPEESVETLTQRIAGAQNSSEQEWVWIEDFFGPVHDTFLIDGEIALQNGEFLVGFNPELTRVGNHVARCLMVRANSPRSWLQEADGILRASFNAAKCRDPIPSSAHLQALETAIQNLRAICLTGPDGVLGESALTLVQTLLEFSVSPPDMSWLPASVTARQRYAGRIRHALRSLRDVTTAERILDAIEVVEVWWESRPKTLTAIEEAIATDGLVLDCGKHELHWKGQLVSVKWSDKPMGWRFILALAKTRGATMVTQDDITMQDEEARSATAISTLKGRVVQLLPPDLQEKITPVRGEGAYRLDLHSSQIHIL